MTIRDNLLCLALILQVHSGLVEVSLDPTFIREQGMYGSERIASTWKTILQNSGANADVYVVKNGEIAIGSSDRSVIQQVTSFLKTNKAWIKNYALNEL